MLLADIVCKQLVLSQKDLESDWQLLRQLQTRYAQLGLYPQGEVDGMWGRLTEGANIMFCKAHHLNNVKTGKYGSTWAKAVIDAKEIPSLLPKWHGGNKDQTIQAIICEAKRKGITRAEEIGYILATVQHETAHSFQPVEEGYYLGDRAKAFQKGLRYQPFWGRGYIQITWQRNYFLYSQKTGLDLVGNPDLVLRPDVALFILIDGMKHGVFTGAKLGDYFKGTMNDYVHARKIVNGMDQAQLIAGYARKWAKLV